MNIKDVRWLVSQQVIIGATVEITATAERGPQNGGGKIANHCAAFNYLNIFWDELQTNRKVRPLINPGQLQETLIQDLHCQPSACTSLVESL